MPTDDYVKREDIFPAVTEIAKEIVFGGQDDDKVVDIINSIPAADVEPKRKTGRWIDENPASFWDPLMHCSVCGEVNIPLAKWRFCPMCGAKMDKEEDDGDEL